MKGESTRFGFATQTSTALLAVKDLRVTFETPGMAPVFAVRGVSFAVERGEVLGIVGESGSGKSAMVTAIPGLLPKTARVGGDIDFAGERCAMIFQEPGRSFDPLQKIGNAFFETFRTLNPAMDRAASDSRAVQLLSETGIHDAKERLGGFPHQFSGGQLQRIGIALALARDPDLLIADEPTTALDVAIQGQIIALLKSIQKKRNIAILFISHNIDAATVISHRIMVLYGGLVMETGSTQDILVHPRHPYTTALLEAAPKFGTSYTQGRLATISGKVPDPRSPEPGCPFAPRCRHTRPACCDPAALTAPCYKVRE